MNHFDYAADCEIVIAVSRAYSLLANGDSRMRSLFLVLWSRNRRNVPGYAQECGFGREDFRPMQGGVTKLGRTQRTLSGGAQRALRRKAGTIEGFRYSSANKNSGITWDEQLSANTSRNPRQDTRHQNDFSGLERSESKLNDVVAYLKQFDSTGKRRQGLSPLEESFAKVQ